MSTVKGQTTIKYVKQGDTLTCSLRSTFPLTQFITNGTEVVSPSFATNQPCIYPVIRSSLTATRVSPLTSGVAWAYNGTTLSFDSSGYSTAVGDLAAGTFYSAWKTIDSLSVPTLTILEEIASADNVDSDYITFQATVNTGFSTTVSASIEITITQTDGEACLSYISVDNGGVIDDDNTSLTAKAHMLIGGTEMSSSVTYVWYKMVVTDGVDGWVATGKTSQSITISASDVATSELYKCVTTYGEKSSEAILEVSDETDALIIYANPTDGSGNTVADEVSDSQTSVTYVPTVVSRSSQTEQSGFTFYYLLTNTSGTTIASQDGGSSFVVTLEHAVTAGGDLTLIITASK